jgi:uncharacterized protein (DUF1778 family)
MARPKKGSETDLEIRTIGVRATKGWADWLERAAKHNRITVASFLDRAAAEHAKETGFDELPPPRLP